MFHTGRGIPYLTSAAGTAVRVVTAGRAEREARAALAVREEAVPPAIATPADPETEVREETAAIVVWAVWAEMAAQEELAARAAYSFCF